jgi:hypothetical protein
VAYELRHRGFPVRPRDGDEGIREEAPGELELAENVDTAFTSGRDDGCLRRNARAFDHAPGAFEYSNSVTIQVHFDAEGAKPFRTLGRGGVDADHVLPAPRENARRGLARACEADDEVGPAGKGWPRLQRLHSL